MEEAKSNPAGGRFRLGEVVHYSEKELQDFAALEEAFRAEVAAKLKASFARLSEDAARLQAEQAEIFKAWIETKDAAMLKRLCYLADIFRDEPELRLLAVRPKYVSALSLISSMKHINDHLPPEEYGGTWLGLVEWFKERCEYVSAFKVEEVLELGHECWECETRSERLGGMEVWEAIEKHYWIGFHKTEHRWVSRKPIELFDKESMSAALLRMKLKREVKSRGLMKTAVKYVPQKEKLYSEEMLSEFRRLETVMRETGEAEIEVEGKRYAATSQKQLARLFLRSRGLDVMRDHSFLVVYRDYVPKKVVSGENGKSGENE